MKTTIIGVGIMVIAAAIPVSAADCPSRCYHKNYTDCNGGVPPPLTTVCDTAPAPAMAEDYPGIPTYGQQCKTEDQGIWKKGKPLKNDECVASWLQNKPCVDPTAHPDSCLPYSRYKCETQRIIHTTTVEEMDGTEQTFVDAIQYTCTQVQDFTVQGFSTGDWYFGGSGDACLW